MIAYVQGELKRIEENSVIVENGGIGYRIFAPIREDMMRVGVGREVTMHTYFSVREDAMQLFGFLTEDELDLFKLLINVKGVGPKFALAILTSLSMTDILFAIAQGDHKALTKAPGVGNKTAQQIILDLKGKVTAPSADDDSFIPSATGGAAVAESGAVADTIAALEALGYAHTAAAEAVRQIPGWETIAEAGDVSQLVRESLKRLVR